MDVTIFETAMEASRALAQRVVQTLHRTPALVLGLPAGRTPIETYAELVRLHAAGRVSFADASVFLLDEFVGLDASQHGSFRRFVTEHLLSGIDLDPVRTHSLDGAAPDPDFECVRFEEAIASAGGIGLMLLGIGANGHIGFNEPGPALAARTHRVQLLATSRRDNAGLFGGDVTRVPSQGLSMGIGTIMRADSIALMAFGDHKAQVVADMLRGGITTQLPASFLQLHRRVEVYLDRAAASAL